MNQVINGSFLPLELGQAIVLLVDLPPFPLTPLLNGDYLFPLHVEDVIRSFFEYVKYVSVAFFTHAYFFVRAQLPIQDIKAGIFVIFPLLL